MKDCREISKHFFPAFISIQFRKIFKRMTRARFVGTVLAAGAALWILGILGVLPLPETIQTQVWPTLPLLALVSLGAYAFINIGYNLLVFKECPEAYHELMQEIQEAKGDLRAKHVDVS